MDEKDNAIMPGAEVVEFDEAKAQHNLENNGPFSEDGGKGADTE